jgi:hypothetical protein
MKKNILINALGISDSGGITVLEKTIKECLEDETLNLFIYCNNNNNIINLKNEFLNYQNITFELINNKGIVNRIFFENFQFRKIVKKLDISLIYNFSGTEQFFIKIPSLVKVQNLMFYSKKLDQTYLQNKDYIQWFKKIFIKRFVFLLMLRKAENIEIQSEHVNLSLSKFLNITKKRFFLKNDFGAEKNDFKIPKKYNFSEKITFLYIVGPHFEVHHKNINDFVNAMTKLKNSNIDFNIEITLTKKQLNESLIWNKELNNITTFLGYLKNKNAIEKLFKDNTILISTSIVETLGLHVIEAIQNGIIAIVPNEEYSKYVYGKDILNYALNDPDSLVEIFKKLTTNDNIQSIEKNILNNQDYLIQNENNKNKKIYQIFNKILD